MLRQRLIVALILLPLGMLAIFLGGWYFTALIGLFLGLAAWEYTQLFRAGGWQPATFPGGWRCAAVTAWAGSGWL